MVNEQEQDSGRRAANQGVRDVIPGPNKINASTPYDFNGKNLTPYGGLLPVITMLEKLGWVRLFWILRFAGYDGGFASAKAAYDSSFLLTSFSGPRRLRWDEVGANGTVSGTR